MSSSRGLGSSDLKAFKEVSNYNKAKDYSGLTYVNNQLKIVDHIKICDHPHSAWISYIFTHDTMYDQKCAVSKSLQKGLARKIQQLLEDHPPPVYDPNQQHIDDPFNSATLMVNDAYIAPVGGVAFDT